MKLLEFVFSAGSLMTRCYVVTAICGLHGDQQSVGYMEKAWAPQDLKQLLTLHLLYGGQYKTPQWYSGYNEVILSARKLNQQLPDAISAFFVLNEHANWRGSRDGKQVAQQRLAFLRRYGLRGESVPLLKLHPSNWNEPFTVLSTATHDLPPGMG